MDKAPSSYEGIMERSRVVKSRTFKTDVRIPKNWTKECVCSTVYLPAEEGVHGLGLLLDPGHCLHTDVEPHHSAIRSENLG